MHKAACEYVSFIFPKSISYGAWQVTLWGEHVYLLTSQGAQNYKAHNVLLNLLLGVQTFAYQKTHFFQPCIELSVAYNISEDESENKSTKKIIKKRMGFWN